jgi:uncharacterized protein with HEPN domain
LNAGRQTLLLEQIRREAVACLSFVEGVDREANLTNDLVQHATAMTVIAIGQAVGDLQRTCPDFAAEHPEIPWRDIVGMRNRIAHGYYALDFEVIWDTIQTSIPELLRTLPPAEE